jgi:sugar phosphate isomerase/epimerase
VRSVITGAGLSTACLAGYAKVCAPGPDGPVIGELKALIELAHRLGCPAIRVFPGAGGQPNLGPDAAVDGRAVDRIGAVLGDLREGGVRLLVETHDSHPTGEAAVRLAEPLGDPHLVAVLWDALHPWRHGEDPDRTRAALAPAGRDYLGYFQLKDVMSPHDLTPADPGRGIVPLDHCAELLRPWTGWVSLEWEKAWYPAIGPVSAPLRAAADWFARHRP